MSNSMVSIIFLGVLGLLFLLLIILTLVLVFTKKKDTDEGYDKEEISDNEYEESSYEDYGQTSYNEYENSNTVLADATEDGDNEELQDVAYDEPEDEADSIETDAPADDLPDEESSASDADDELDLDGLLDEISEDSEENVSQDDSDNQEEEKASDNEQSVTEESIAEVDEIPPVVTDDLGDYSDSAFAPVQADDKLSDEALIASVKEAQVLSENVMNNNPNPTEPLFGVGDELDRYKKKTPKKSTVSSDEDFYWYNKMDVMEKPSYKTTEMYYHYFNIPKDCIDDLLVEMYDCALVRTEEIRYIAYGIKPKAVSLKDIMKEGNYYYTNQPKQKEPLPQDLIRIYEKWCGYVDKLFEKIEIHADEYTIQEIRKMLYEYGRNDVDVLLEGR